MAYMLESSKFITKALVENFNKTKLAKSTYNFESANFIEFKFKDKFEWDFKNYRNSILTNRK